MSTRSAAASLILPSLALLCWLLMFLAGTDVWHDTGRLDLWHLEGPPYSDLRAFVVTYYALLPILVVQFAVAVVHVRRGRIKQP